MSAEGGGGYKPRSLADTKVLKEGNQEAIGSASKEAVDIAGGTSEKEKRSGTATLPQSTKAAQKTDIDTTSTNITAHRIHSKLESPIKSDRSEIPTKQEPSLEDIGQSSSQAETSPRQVIAVSASKGPAAFFNLARKFLVTDETCDLSALEGAIVSAVDAAHLLERSKLATIIRIQTSYVAVGPKRKKGSSFAIPESQGGDAQHHNYPPEESFETGGATTSHSKHIADTRKAAHGPGTLPGPGHEASVARTPASYASSTSASLQAAEPSHSQVSPSKGKDPVSGGKELRRARMIITVKRTDDYKKWLDENPLQDIIAVEDDDDQHTSTSRSQHSSV